MSRVIKVENLSKRYRLGAINRDYLYLELQSWWARVRGREDPNTPIQHPKNHSRHRGMGEFWALREVSFEVNSGEVVGIIGRNGTGKSTLLKILSEITAPTAGRALMNGTVASLLEVGTGFHPELTGKENVYLNGSILGMDRSQIRKKYDEIVDFSGLEEFMETPVKRYSSGMKLRLAFSVAAHLEPEILILDEVLAVGDASFQQKCLDRVGEEARSGRTILFVSHNLAAVQSLCNRGIVLDEGRVVFDDTAEVAVEHYLREINRVRTSLRERTDRIGNGHVKVVALELRSRDGKPTSTIRCGEDVDVCFFLENYTSKLLSDIYFKFRVKKSGLEIPGFVHWTGPGERIGTLGPKGVAICRLHELPLCEATYRIDFGIMRDGQFLDRLEDALEFSVQGSGHFGLPELSQYRHASCAVRGEWMLLDDIPQAAQSS